MEIVLAMALFAAPLIGFYTPLWPDGWTIYRDRTLLLFSIPLLSMIFFIEPAFGMIFSLLLVRYDFSLEGLHGPAIWAFVFTFWLWLTHLDRQYVPLILTAVVLAACTQIGFAFVDFINLHIRKRRKLSDTPVCGSLGNRTYLAAYLAIVAPIVAVAELWWLLLIFFAAVLICASRGGLLAFMIGVLVAWPKMAVPIIAVGGAVLLLMIFKHNVFLLNHVLASASAKKQILNTIKSRKQIWLLTLAYTLKWPHWLIGRGFNSFNKHAIKWVSMYGVKEGFMHAHNDGVQFFFEYGLLGLVALGLFTWKLSFSMAFGHSLTGSVAALLTVSMFTFPHHIGPVAVTILAILAMLSIGAV